MKSYSYSHDHPADYRRTTAALDANPSEQKKLQICHLISFEGGFFREDADIKIRHNLFF